jgi:DNA-binding transcriptional ArsR family regulator
MPVQDFIVRPEAAPVTVALEPARNAIHSLLLLTEADYLSGLGEWVGRTAAALSPAEAERNRLVIVGFYHAILPEGSWPSLPAYIDRLASRDPRSLRDRMLDVYSRQPLLVEDQDQVCGDEPAAVDWAAVLSDVDNYLDFLRARFPAKSVDDELEAQAYRYVIDPPAMQTLIVEHLRTIWDAHLAAEWARVEPMLRDSVHAFRQVDLSGMTRRQAVEFVVGQEVEGPKWDDALEQAREVLLIPSAHVGPYLGRACAGGTFWVLFGARLPEGGAFHAPDLSRAEIVVRLGALADDSRLRILRIIAERGELASQDIIAELSFSQSAASRHLKQLSATGFLTERRCNGAKCYRLNRERIENSLRAVSSFLLEA